MKEFSLGIIGSGAAAAQHCEAVALVEGLRVEGLCEMVKNAHVPTWAHGLRRLDYDQLLASERVQVVAICTPPGTHVAIALDCLRQGKAVVVEKPVCATIEEFDRLVQARCEHGIPVAVMHQHRYALPEQALRTVWSPAAVASVEVSKPRSAAYFEVDWRSNRSLAGGGAFAHLGIHYVDLACQLFGMPSTVEGTVSCDVLPGVDTRVRLNVGFSQGARLSVDCDCLGTARLERLRVGDGEASCEILNGAANWSRANDDCEMTAAVPKIARRARVYQEICQALQAGRVRLGLADVEHAQGSIRILQAVNDLTARTSLGPRNARVCDEAIIGATHATRGHRR